MDTPQFATPQLAKPQFDGPILVTERLILRPPQGSDFPAWAEFSAEEDTMHFIGGAKSPAEAWRVMCSMIGAWHVAGFAMFSMIERSSGAWIGRTGPWHPHGWPGDEVGWAVRASHAGQGFAREAAIASIDFAFDRLGWSDVIHTIVPDNAASIKLAQRLGSTNRGPTRLPEPFADLKIDAWGQTREQWRANRATL